jgi:hypothetical protein
MVNIDRTMSPQRAGLPTMRAVRAVFCWLLRQGSSNPLARSSPDHRGAFQAASNAFVAEEQRLGDVGPSRWLRPSRRLLHASSSGDGPLVGDRGSNLLPTPPPPHWDPREQRRRNASRAGRSRPSREIRHLKSRLRDIAEGTLSGALDPRWAAVVVQAYNALIRALEQERKIVEQKEIMERLERLEARRGMAS